MVVGTRGMLDELGCGSRSEPILRRNARHFSGLREFCTEMRLRSVEMQKRIVAVGLLTRQDLSLLGPAFDRAWPVEQAPAFNDLLRAIDEADGKLQDSRLQLAEDES